MLPHKIITKSSINTDLKSLNGKIVLFVDKKGIFDHKYFLLKSKVLEAIKGITRSEKVKKLLISEGITTTIWVNNVPTDYLIIKIEKNLSDEKLDEIAKLVSDFKGKSKVSILWDLDHSHKKVARIIQLREYSYVEFKKDTKLFKKVGDTVFYVPSKKITKNFQKINDAVSDGVFWCRDLVNAPANILNTKEFSSELKELKKIGVKVTVINENELYKMGMNALLAVGKGSSNPSKVVIMEWKGSSNLVQPIALLGKGVMFDTGGISLKPASGMSDMTMDMAGAATVAGVLKSVALCNLKINLVGLVGLVENMPGPQALRPGDIINSMKGDSIEVNNTDAEGRLVLADLLWYAQKRFKPGKIFDLATLTGAIIVALGHEFAGLFSNNDKFCEEFLLCCKENQEKVWRMPLDMAFKKNLKSKLADISNVGGRQGSSSIAAMFLENFVKKETPWIHLDIAGVAKTNSVSLYSKGGATGWGVISIFEYLRASINKKMDT